MEIHTENLIYDIIDILIVSYVIYKLILLVRGTRAVQLIKGIFVVILAWALSSWLNLRTLQWMMNQMFTFGVLAVMIIFQPELRRALEQLGRGKLFSRASNESDEEIHRQVNEVIKAIHELSRRRIGALIVYERETGLSEYMESGTPIEARLSSELLINIFTPHTPLHDGAVIIQKNQIAAAACYLPLSENPFISKELGTRHRSAIGVTEVSDAIAIVVSEETGQISLCINGQIVRNIQEEALVSKLYEELKPGETARERPSFWRWRGGHNG